MTAPGAGSIKTVHIVQRMAPGGIETLVLDLIGDNHNPSMVFSLESTADALVASWPALAQHDQKLVGFDRKEGLSPALIVSIARRLRSIQPTTVIAHHVGPLLYGGAAARLAGVPKLIHVEHDVWHYRNPTNRVVSKICGRVLRPDHIAVSNQVAAGMRAIFPSSSITVIPPGIDMARFTLQERSTARSRIGIDPSLRIVGTIGRLVPVKSQATMLAALCRLPETIHAVIVGDGPERTRLAEYIRQNRIDDRVHFLGHRDDIESILPAFDVFCLPSLNEGLPRSVLEAQACGVPVVASDVGGLGDAVCQDSGRLVPPANHEALAKALSEVLTQGVGAAGPRAFVERKFSLTSTLDAYRRICA